MKVNPHFFKKVCVFVFSNNIGLWWALSGGSLKIGVLKAKYYTQKESYTFNYRYRKIWYMDWGWGAFERKRKGMWRIPFIFNAAQPDHIPVLTNILPKYVRKKCMCQTLSATVYFEANLDWNSWGYVRNDFNFYMILPRFVHVFLFQFSFSCWRYRNFRNTVKAMANPKDNSSIRLTSNEVVLLIFTNSKAFYWLKQQERGVIVKGQVCWETL